jgi:ADP-ribose pyrophosphatase
LQLRVGYLEDGEPPEACARRELFEETGFEASDWKDLGSFCPDGNRGFGRAHFFLARSAQAGEGAGEAEGLTLRRVPLDNVPGLLLSAEFGELSAVAGTGLALARLGMTYRQG